MGTNELRIGNYVMCKNKIGLITSLNKLAICFTYLGEDDVCMAYIDAISPVVLTDELLFKLGFGDAINVYDDYRAYQISAEIENIYLLYKNGMYYHAYEYDCTIIETIPCTGLHSLQNKYFDLNGKELEVKL